MIDRHKFEALRWLVEMGADEAIGDVPVDRLAPMPQTASTSAQIVSAAPSPRAARAPAPAQPPAVVVTPPAAASAQGLAAAAQTLAQLKAAIAGFDGCA